MIADLRDHRPSAPDSQRSEIPIATRACRHRPHRVHTEVGLSILHRPTHTIAASCGDIATVPILRERLLGMPRAGMRLLILGLSGVSSCDVAEPTVCAEYIDRVLGPWRGRA